MRFSLLQDWLTWQEGLHSSEIDMGLERVRAVALRMQLLVPEEEGARPTVVSIAGTNGKGSCVATLEALCLKNGVRVGAFTSPHLHHYNERIRVGGVPVDDRLICESFERIDRARADISLTYFEFGTLAAIDIFWQQGVDVMLLEVGLGGRLDAVNIMDADVAVVTSIAVDHEAWLGSDVGVIGHEKAGIYRAGRWAICADEQAPESVADYAHTIGARWLAMGLSLNTEVQDDHWCWSGMSEEGEALECAQLPLPNLPLPSVAAALQAFVLLGYPLPEDLSGVLLGLSLPGRAQRIEHRGIRCVLDVAHNPAAAALLATRMRAEPVEGKTYCLLAVMADKDRVALLQALRSQVDVWHVAALPQVARAASAEALQADLQGMGIAATTHVSVQVGLQKLMAIAQKTDRVLVMGSFFTVAEALSYFDQ